MTADHGSDQGGGRFDLLLRGLRRAAGLTQAELAGRARVGVRTVRDLERGRASRPQRTTVELLAEALGLTGADRAGFLAAARGAGPDAGGQPRIAVPGEPAGRALPRTEELIGRAAEVAELSAVLGRIGMGAPGPVTLVGLAGVGKTSLALAVGHRVADRHPGGVGGIVVTEHSTYSDVLTTVAAVFGVGRAADLAARLAGAPALVVVDAVERAPDPVAEAVQWLVTAAPSLRVLATGRHPIGLVGEQVWPVGPLDVPPPDPPPGLAEVLRYPAVELFLARLRQVRRSPPEPDEVAALVALVRRLGGLPLALELAAARGRVLDLNEMLDRYGDRVLDLAPAPGAAREAVASTLRDAVAASYRLLEPDERYALRRLSTFRNRWSVELAELIIADEPADPPGRSGATEAAASTQVGGSARVGGSAGYAKGPTGAGGLPGSAGLPGGSAGPTGVGGLRAVSVGRTGVGATDPGSGSAGPPGAGGQALDAGITGAGTARSGGAVPVAGDPVPLLDRLLELGLLGVRGAGPFRFRLVDVVRDFAAERAVARGELAAARRRHARILADLAVRTAPQLVGSGLAAATARLDDVASDLSAALAHAANDDPHTALRLAAALPRWWRFRGRDTVGRHWLRRLLDDPRTADADPVLRAWAQVGVAQLALEHNDGTEELPAVRAALAEFSRRGDVAGELAARTLLCRLWSAIGAHDEVRREGEAVLALASRTGRVRDMAVAQNNLVWHEIRVGDLAAARRRLAQVDRLAVECGEPRLRALAAANLAEVARLDGRYDEAVALGRRAAAALEESADPGHRPRILTTIGLALAEAGRLPEAAEVLARLRRESGGGWRPERRDALAPTGTSAEDAACAVVEATIAMRRGERERAAEWFGAAVRAYDGAHDVRDMVGALVGLAANTDPEDDRAEVLRRLDRVCRRGGITLLPRERIVLGWPAPAPVPTPRRPGLENADSRR